MKLKYLFWIFLFLTCTRVSAQAINLQTGKNYDLQSLIGLALNNHPSIRARRYDRLGATAELDAARWQYFPTPTTSVQVLNKLANVKTDTQLTTIGLKQPIWTNGRLSAATESAKAKQKIADASLQEVERDIALEVIQVWGDLRIALARSTIFNESILKHRNSLEQIRRRANEGLSAQSDVLLARGRLNAVLAELSLASAALDSARQRLNNLIGSIIAVELLQLNTSNAGLEIGQTGEIEQTEEMIFDPTLSRLKAEILLIDAEIKNAKSALLPEVSAQVLNRHGDVSGTVTQWVVGLESRWGAGLSQLSSEKVIQQRKETKLAEIDARKLKVRDQIRIEWNNLSSARERLKSFESVLQTSKDVAESWDRQFLSGKKTWQDVMNAVREISQAEIQLAETSINLDLVSWRLAVLEKGLPGVLGMNR